MSISFVCDSCGKNYKVGDELAGKKATCKQCGAKLTVPSASPPADDEMFSALELAASGPSEVAPAPPPRAAMTAAPRPPKTKSPVRLSLTDSAARSVSFILVCAFLTGAILLNIQSARLALTKLPEDMSSRVYVMAGLGFALQLILFFVVMTPVMLLACTLASNWTNWTPPEPRYLRAAGTMSLPNVGILLIIGLAAQQAKSLRPDWTLVIGLVIALPFVMVLGLKELVGLKWSTTIVAAVLLLFLVPAAGLGFGFVSNQLKPAFEKITGLDAESLRKYAEEHRDELRAASNARPQAQNRPAPPVQNDPPPPQVPQRDLAAEARAQHEKMKAEAEARARQFKQQQPNANAAPAPDPNVPATPLPPAPVPQDLAAEARAKAEAARKEAERAARNSSQKPANPVAPKPSPDKPAVAGASPIPDILKEIKSSADMARSHSIQKLLDVPVDEAYRDQVAATLEAIVLSKDNFFSADDACKALEIWWRPTKTVDALLPTITKYEFFPPKNVIRMLATTKDKRVVYPIVRWIIKAPDEVKAAMIAMGPMAEEKVADVLTEKNNDARKTAAQILEQIGTRKSLSALSRASKDKRDALAALAAQDAIDAINKRHPPATATKPATNPIH